MLKHQIFSSDPSSSDEKDVDMLSAFVWEIMPRNYFKKVKLYVHVCDNEKLSSDNKWTKLHPLISILNKPLLSLMSL